MGSGIIKQQIHRELLILRRQKQSFLQSLLFFLMFIAFFPLAIPYDPEVLRLICPGVVWLSATLAIFLSAERFYQQDIEYGCLEQWMVKRYSLITYVYIKILIHGGIHLLAMLVVSPVIALIYQLSAYEWLALVASLLLGLPSIIAMCGLVSAFGSYGKDRALVMLLILFPLILPMIMLGSSCLATAMQGLGFQALAALMLALSIGMLTILPLASTLILTICIEHGF
jgi:heme exporter protein B